MKKSLLLAALLAAMLQRVLLAAPAAAAESAAETKVTIDNFTFTPQSVTIKAGTTVTWVNQDDIPHTVVASEKAFRSKVLDTDNTYSFTFTTAGTYQYFCSLHPHMTGTIVVEPAAGGGAAP